MDRLPCLLLCSFLVLVSFYCHAAVVTIERAECVTLTGQCDYPDNARYGEDPSALNAEQLKTVCKHYQNATKCSFNWLNKCFPGGLSVPEDLVKRVDSLFDVCDQPDLHAQGQIILPCGKKLSELNKTDSSPVITNLQACQDSFSAAAKVSVKNYMFSQLVPTSGNTTATKIHFCCAGIKFTECAAAAVSGTCSLEAINLGRHASIAILKKLECPDQLLTSDECAGAGVETIPFR